LPVRLPASFDPAPILYPTLLPVYLALLLNSHVHGVILPNLILSICSLPRSLIPSVSTTEQLSVLHWMLSCVPVLFSDKSPWIIEPITLSPSIARLSHEIAVLLYPLHQTLCQVLYKLTTTSLLPAELELLSIALINLLLLARSPQAVILQALLWGGGVSILILGGPVIRWGITLARVPKWRFRRIPVGSKPPSTLRTLFDIVSMRRVKREVFGSGAEGSAIDTDHSSDDGDIIPGTMARSPEVRIEEPAKEGNGVVVTGIESVPVSPREEHEGFGFSLSGITNIASRAQSRRHTLPALGIAAPRIRSHTPSGRKKRSASSSVRAFFSLTQSQAAARKWLYAGYVYLVILAVILAGVREYVGRYALNGNEPVGWALGYLFGDLPAFRFEVVKANLERWICLPIRTGDVHEQTCSLGWVEHARHADLGEANTRLVLSAYFLVVLAFGLAVVFTLSPVYEVDTRRKVFHFMMVAMFLPATFVDPTYAALALSLILAIFLLLDLLRASQLPPLSKPIASFLTPYVDGRDLRGPVVISHIFLLIGCAIPLWLSLAALPRGGTGCLQGWEVPTRDVSMVSGVVCVGLGDAAASLIGRRWGRSKWMWGGGKSLEGSVAFASAVFAGLMAARVWLRVGGWPVSSGDAAGLGMWKTSARDAGICASVASLTEAVLTGGNDNVVVPVILWTCVKSLGL